MVYAFVTWKFCFIMFRASRKTALTWGHMRTPDEPTTKRGRTVISSIDYTVTQNGSDGNDGRVGAFGGSLGGLGGLATGHPAAPLVIILWPPDGQ